MQIKRFIKKQKFLNQCAREVLHAGPLTPKQTAVVQKGISARRDTIAELLRIERTKNKNKNGRKPPS